MLTILTPTRISLLLTFLVFFNSCISYKHVPYFQDIPQTGEVQEEISNYSIVTIQNHDILTISVTSLNPEASALFNGPISQHSILANTVSTVNTNSTNTIVNATPQTGILVDENGDIKLPYIGTLHVAGLTTPQARDMMAKKLETYLKEPLVNVRIANFKVGVFGDVNTPGFLTVPNERMTLMEAIFSAGDLKITGKRNNVLLIREIDGKRKFVRFDLNSKTTFTSPYFYLKTNDLVYVQPGNVKDKRDSIFGNVGFISSILSLVLIFIRLKP